MTAINSTSMHFGPEWMRPKPRAQALPSPPLSTAIPTSGNSTYSAQVSPATGPSFKERDEAHPFRYTKEELLNIYKDGGGKAGLGLEVERWEGVVRELEGDPVSLREINEAERKLLSGPINSESRRRQSTDYLSLSTQNYNSDRPRMIHSNSNNSPASPMRERFSGLMARRRDSTDPPAMPRKLSLSSIAQPSLNSPREPGTGSPRPRLTPGFDGVLGGGGDTWTARRRASEGLSRTASRDDAMDAIEGAGPDIREEDELNGHVHPEQNTGNSFQSSDRANSHNVETGLSQLHLNGAVDSNPQAAPTVDISNIDWSYLDPQGQTQGPFKAELMQKWYNDGYFTPDLLMKRTTLDTEWVPVGNLARDMGEQFFVAPRAPPVPPGLLPRTESPAHGVSVPFASDPQYGSPYQPSPGRISRSTTLESYGPGVPSSPSSSFGGRFKNASPDPTILTGRSAGLYDPLPIGGNRGYGNVMDSPSSFSGRRNTYGDASPSLQHMSPVRGVGVEGYPFGNQQYTQAWPNELQNINGLNPSMTMAASPLTAHHLHSAGTPGYNDRYEQPAYGSMPHNPGFDQRLPPNNPIPVSPWGAAPSRAIPSDAQIPLTINATSSRSATPAQPSPWGTASMSSRPDSSSTPWTPATSEPSTLISSHSRPQQHESPVAVPKIEDLIPAAVAEEIIHVDDAPPVAAVAPTTKARAKSISKNQAPAPSQAPAPTPSVPAIPVPSPSPSPAPLPKTPAWSTEDDSKKPKTSGTGMTLREIQEAEAKKTEAKKIAEREREKAVRAAAAATATSSASEDMQSFSWGLPTSQTGNRSNVVSAKDSSSITSSPSTPSATPVWTTATKAPTAKKSMKEIQEEEQRRKKAAAAQAVKDTASAAPPRRGYAETTSKVPAATPTSAGVWNTVGSSGKVTAVVSPAPRVPAVTAPSSAPRVNGGPAAKVSATPRPATIARVDDTPPTPSNDFVKWVGDSLKGLNSSVNVEEIFSMLLTFPLDPDPSTVELIAEMIYTNSTTLDGRRFASEFVSKRKADAARKGSSTSSVGKTISIADVVKSQPKPQATNEWGGFKVVNKKKKGGR